MNPRRALAVAYLLTGAALLAYAAVDPKWGIPGFLVLGAWLIFVGIRCSRSGDVAPLVRRTTWVFLGIAGVGVVLGVWQRLSGQGNATGGLFGGRISLPFGLALVSAVVAAVSQLLLPRLERGEKPG